MVKGARVELVAPGGEPERVLFPDPAGEQDAFLLGHAEPLMLHHNIGLMNGAQEISVKGVLGDGTELIELILSIMDMGLTKKQAISLAGLSISPYDLLTEYLSSAAFAESNPWGLELKTVVSGHKDGKPAEVEYRLTGEGRGAACGRGRDGARRPAA